MTEEMTAEERAYVKKIQEMISAGKMKCSWCDEPAIRGGTQHRFCEHHHQICIEADREYGWQNIPYDKVFGKPIREYGE